ncbi:MAG: single-stranded DNA-binding protein [Firmicutes bacterium]|nr:single-stranded DNA-binding protein [Bacillota bacterium]
MNTVILVGRLARDPEIRYTQSQTAVCSATIAVNRGKDSNGNDRGADFIRMTIFNKPGEVFQKYLTKGRQVAVQGRLNTGSYKNKNGETVYTTDVIVEKFDFIGNKQDAQPPAADVNDIPEGFEPIDDDDIPF